MFVIPQVRNNARLPYSSEMTDLMRPIALDIQTLSKTYKAGHHALRGISLQIPRGEIFALLGPNGAGKTTLIGIACGLVNATSGSVHIEGHNVASEFRTARKLVGLVPQELTTEAFETVQAAVAHSRGLFGLQPDPAKLEQVLRSLALWDKRDTRVSQLSGGMKRRVLIAKALVHEPRVLFLDEPSAGVDVELRRDIWNVVRGLRDQGVTILLTTHYIEEAEQIADRVPTVCRVEKISSDGRVERKCPQVDPQTEERTHHRLCVMRAERSAVVQGGSHRTISQHRCGDPHNFGNLGVGHHSKPEQRRSPGLAVPRCRHVEYWTGGNGLQGGGYGVRTDDLGLDSVGG